MLQKTPITELEPTLENLARLLRSPDQWVGLQPSQWNYQFGYSCALRVGRDAWGDDSPHELLRRTDGKAFHSIFCSGGLKWSFLPPFVRPRGLEEVTPAMVADRIDKHTGTSTR